MKLYGYGEDALTLWALKTKLHEILEALKDNSSLSECELFFRPSFGRRGGKNSSQFGEFDFIILAKDHLYLGESKWERSPEVTDTGTIILREEQTDRHRVFSLYVKCAFGQWSNWNEFCEMAKEKINKPLPLAGKLLAENLESIMKYIRNHFSSREPEIRNILLYLYGAATEKPIPKTVRTVNGGNNFKIVALKYPDSDIKNYISFEI